MSEFSINSVPILLLLLVPGFVWSRIHRYLQLSPSEDKEFVLGPLTLSAVNLALWSWEVPWLWSKTRTALQLIPSGHGSLPDLPWPLALNWLAVTLISPALLGLLTGYENRAGRLRRFLTDHSGLDLLHPIDTAWEYVFTERSRQLPLWVTVTLTDGSVVEGYYATESLASWRRSERDLYLELRYVRSSSDTLIPSERSAGVWIPGTSIKLIEFRIVLDSGGGDFT